jgi:hypothetical protein
MVGLETPIDAQSKITVLREIFVGPENSDKLCTFLHFETETYGSDLTTFFLLHCKSRKQQCWPSPILERTIS